MGVRAPCTAPALPQFGYFPSEKAYFGEIPTVGVLSPGGGGPPGEI